MRYGRVPQNGGKVLGNQELTVTGWDNRPDEFWKFRTSLECWAHLNIQGGVKSKLFICCKDYEDTQGWEWICLLSLQFSYILLWSLVCDSFYGLVWMYGNLGILSIYIWASTDCLVLMPFIFNLFLLYSILYIAARSSSTTGLLSSWTYKGSYCFKANIHIFRISVNSNGLFPASVFTPNS